MESEGHPNEFVIVSHQGWNGQKLGWVGVGVKKLKHELHRTVFRFCRPIKERLETIR